MSKPDQDLRFDVPAVGLDTIATMREVKAAVLAIEAGKTLIFDRPEMLKTADQAGIAVWGISWNLQPPPLHRGLPAAFPWAVFKFPQSPLVRAGLSE